MNTNNINKSTNPFYLKDKWLDKWIPAIDERHSYFLSKKATLAESGTLGDFASGHLYYGTQTTGDNVIIREWAPDAVEIYLVGTINNWTETDNFRFDKINDNGDWELKLKPDQLPEGSLFKLSIKWEGGSGLRIPAYATRVVQDDATKIFSAEYAPSKCSYRWKNNSFVPGKKARLFTKHIQECPLKMKKFPALKNLERRCCPVLQMQDIIPCS